MRYFLFSFSCKVFQVLSASDTGSTPLFGLATFQELISSILWLLSWTAQVYSLEYLVSGHPEARCPKFNNRTRYHVLFL